MEKQSKSKPTAEEIVAKNVGAFRFLLGLDYERFAERAHMTAERVKEIESGINVLENGIELVRIAEACSIQYSELFEDADSGATGMSQNAHFPDVVYKRIYKMIQKNYKSNAAFAKLIGVHSSSVGLWLNGKVRPRPMAFQNILTVLKLKSYDLEAMVDSAKENKKPIENAVVVEPKKEEVVVADDFESKVVKIMRLQKELPELVDRLEKMQREIETLKNELYKLM